MWAAAPAPLTSLRAIHALTNDQASEKQQVAFEATVTYFRGYEGTLFVQDDDVGILVKIPLDTKLAPGDRVLVRGTTQGSFRPLVLASSVTLLRQGAPLKPLSAGFGELIRGQRDCVLVTIHATIRSANFVVSPQAPVRAGYLQMLTDGGYVDATVDTSDPAALKNLLDADVEVTGVAGGKFDNKMQQTGVLLHVSSLADVKVIQRSGSNPWSLAVTPMDLILNGFYVKNLTQRVRVHGTITYYQPGVAVVLQNGDRSLWVSTWTSDPMQIGDAADATGFPDVHDGFLILTDSQVQDSHIPAPITPQQVTWRQLAESGNLAEGHHNDLVSIEGQVVSEVREATQDEYVLVSEGNLFSAVYRHPNMPDGISLPPMRQVPVGARARVTGICIPSSSDPLAGQVAFDMLLRSFDDIVVVANPSPLNVTNLILVVGVLLVVVVVVGARGWAIERKVRRQNAALAHIERRRSDILEDINGSSPLAEILEKITELVSAKLHGASCWCEIVDGALLGKCPQNINEMRIERCEIPTRSGSPLGAIFAAFGPLTKPSANEPEALSMAAGLAALAIETRRLYSDLRRRSEFDLLTDIHNRFSLDKRLDAVIDESRQNASIFGLIYIDLDRFKEVNDVYGHQVGDLYLQQVALRMKRQLRSHDTLARIGGDEFAVLVPVIRNRAEAQEIVHRIEHCFDGPFAVQGHILHGSASVGLAIYPEDGATKDSLMSTSDADMYLRKHARQQDDTKPDKQRTAGLAPERG
jgi:diguanylate cyclase (GGDEF)-like protein